MLLSLSLALSFDSSSSLLSFLSLNLVSVRFFFSSVLLQCSVLFLDKIGISSSLPDDDPESDDDDD